MSSLRCTVLGSAPLSSLDSLKVTVTGISGRPVTSYTREEWAFSRPEHLSFNIPASEALVCKDPDWRATLLGRLQRDLGSVRAQAIVTLCCKGSPIEFLEALGYARKKERKREGWVSESLEQFRTYLYVEETTLKVEVVSECQQENLDQHLERLSAYALLLSPVVSFETERGS